MDLSQQTQGQAGELKYPDPRLQNPLTSRIKGSTGMKVPVLSDSSVKARTQCMRRG